MRKVLNSLIKQYLAYKSWSTDRKILVFESDDWGSIRMPNKKVREELSQRNSNILKNTYAQLDSIARTDDLNALFDVLIKYRDYKGNPPVITANTIMANPDFEKIERNGFAKYEYETFDQTISRLNSGRDILKLWKDGIEQRVFKPQLHGREHLHALLWLEELRAGNQDLLDAFHKGCFGVPYRPLLENKRKSVMAALDHSGIPGELEFQEMYVQQGAQLFQDYFGYRSRSFIATAYIWHNNIEKTLKTHGVDYLQGLNIQYIPDTISKRFKKKLHYTGQKNKWNQYYLARNAFFEPVSDKNLDWNNDVLQKIELAFKNKSPAIVGTHRINFIGSLEESNRTENLKSFNSLLEVILKRWPEVEFMSSDELGTLIANS